MYEYTIRLPFKIENCIQCPFRNQQTMYEDIQSHDKLSGITQIMRLESFCPIKNERILTSEFASGYKSTCPLNGCMKEINNDDK